MNAIELLEALLRGPATGSPAPTEPTAAEPQNRQPARPETRGADILRDILGGGAAGTAAPAPAARTMPTASEVSSDPIREDEKVDVRELLRQAKEREAAAAAGRPYRPAPSAPTGRWSGAPAETARAEAPMPVPTPAARPAARPREDEATLLIRAMINVAKADGRLDRDEEQKILKHLGQPSREVVAFIQSEFQKPLDVKEFAWSVPLGLEQKVYAISLAVIDLDQREESAYLKDLAHGLRLAPDLCAELHEHFGAPVIG
jgi:hypothetical protein